MLRYTYVINKTRIALTASFWKVKIGHLQTNVLLFIDPWLSVIIPLEIYFSQARD